MSVKTISKKKATIILVVCCLLVGVFSSVVSVKAAKTVNAKSVSVNIGKVTLAVGDVSSITAKMNPVNSTNKLTWKTSNSKVATVTSSGVITAVKEGSATISVSTSNKKTAKVAVTVKKYLTSSETLALIKSNTLTEERVMELVASGTLSEDEVKELIADNTLSEDDVLTLIHNNSLSETYVESLIEDMAFDDVKQNYNNWADGTELSYYGSLPFSQSDYSGFAITDICVKKYHTTETISNHKQVMKYTVTISGTNTYPSSYHFSVGIRGFDSNGIVSSCETYADFQPTDATYVTNGNNFTCTVDIYDIYQNYDSFIITYIDIPELYL